MSSQNSIVNLLLLIFHDYYFHAKFSCFPWISRFRIMGISSTYQIFEQRHLAVRYDKFIFEQLHTTVAVARLYSHSNTSYIAVNHIHPLTVLSKFCEVNQQKQTIQKTFSNRIIYCAIVFLSNSTLILEQPWFTSVQVTGPNFYGSSDIFPFLFIDSIRSSVITYFKCKCHGKLTRMR